MKIVQIQCNDQILGYAENVDVAEQYILHTIFKGQKLTAYRDSISMTVHRKGFDVIRYVFYPVIVIEAEDVA